LTGRSTLINIMFYYVWLKRNYYLTSQLFKDLLKQHEAEELS